MNFKKLFIIIFSTIAIIVAAAVVWRVQETEYYKTRLQHKKHPLLWKVFFENRSPELDSMMLGKWQSKDNPRWFKVYYNDYDETEKLYWGKEWDESEDVFEDDLQYHGNGWFRWEKRGKKLHEYATMDARDVPIYRGYKVRYLSQDSLAYSEFDHKKKVFRFTRSCDSVTEEKEEIIPTSSVTDSLPIETANDTKEPQKLPAPIRATSLSVSSTSVSAPAEGKTENITVTCNTAWEIEPLSASMCSVTRNGDILTIEINENTSTDSRAAFITVKSKDGTKEQRIIISQNGKTDTPPSKTVYNVHNVLDNYTIQGNQITNYTFNAEELKVLRDAISSWGEARTGAITENGCGIVVYGDEGFQATAKGREFSNFLKSIEELRGRDEKIGDITLNQEGNYVIVLGNCGYIICGLPEKFEEVLNRLNKSNEKILSVSLDDGDNWAYVSAKQFGASTNANLTFMQEAYEKFGKLESVCITEKGIIVCCQNGVYFNNVPKSVIDGVIGFHNAGRKPKVIKFTDSGTYLITDGKSACAYSM